jgi:hypothetical protein
MLGHWRGAQNRAAKAAWSYITLRWSTFAFVRLWAAIGDLLVDFTPSQRANMFAAAGYEPN